MRIVTGSALSSVRIAVFVEIGQRLFHLVAAEAL
jgi:hypothetical protein